MGALGKSILIIEDSDTMRSFFAQVVKRLGFENVYASSTVESTASLDLTSVDVVLLDWLLPGTNGATFTKRVRAGKTRLPVSVLIVLVTGHADQKLVAEARECGVDTILVKPVSGQQLESRIKAALIARAAAPAGTPPEPPASGTESGPPSEQ